ncbi:MAG: hypothetical protein ABFD12_03070 [Syntrophorhabdus sp.]
MMVAPKSGEIIRSKFNGRTFTIEMVGETQVVLEERDLSIRFVTTLDDLRSFYEYAGELNFRH